MTCYYQIITLLFLLTPGIQGYSQDLASHQWKDRLVIVLANQENNHTFVQQIQELKNHKPGLKKRKILVYQAIPEKVRTGLSTDKDWQASKDFLKKFTRSESLFEILLIGLDGGVKHRKETLLPCDELFKVIDRMPMRKEEIRRK